MEFSDYQIEAAKTAIYPPQYAVTYPALGLANEAGEVLGKLKKLLRDKEGAIEAEDVEAIASECGDVLWYLAILTRDLGISLDHVAENNIKKLKDRQERNALGGSGDNR